MIAPIMKWVPYSFINSTLFVAKVALASFDKIIEDALTYYFPKSIEWEALTITSLDFIEDYLFIENDAAAEQPQPEP